jgi:Domain of unknown function (DUF4118)
MRRYELDPWAGAALGGVAAIVLAAALVPLREDLTSSTLALLLVLPVLLGAMTGGRLGGAVSAAVAVMGFDFFLTRPYLSMQIDSSDDVETAVVLLIVALVIGTVAASARRATGAADEGRAEIEAIHRVAEAAVGAGEPSRIVELARRELVRVLQLTGCEFDNAAGTSSLAVLEHSGTYESTRLHFVHGGFTLPSHSELLVLSKGEQVGRFVLHATPNTSVSLDARLAAVAIADQVGITLANDGKRKERA